MTLQHYISTHLSYHYGNKTAMLQTFRKALAMYQAAPDKSAKVQERIKMYLDVVSALGQKETKQLTLF